MPMSLLTSARTIKFTAAKITCTTKNGLVRHIDLSWNQIEASLILIYEKLIELGFVYYNGNIEIIEPVMEGNYETHPEKA